MNVSHVQPSHLSVKTPDGLFRKKDQYTHHHSEIHHLRWLKSLLITLVGKSHYRPPLVDDQHAWISQEKPGGNRSLGSPGEEAFDRVGCRVANVTRSLFQGEGGAASDHGGQVALMAFWKSKGLGHAAKKQKDNMRWFSGGDCCDGSF